MAKKPIMVVYEDDGKAARKQPATISASPSESNEQLQRRLYKKLLEKHASIISAQAPQSVGEIKSLVDKEDLTVQFIIQGFLPPNYRFDQDYDGVLERVFNHLREQIQFVKVDIDINFWLKPKEVMELKAADDEDLAVLLCSAMHALGDDNAHVTVCELDNLTPHTVVSTEYRGRFYWLDLCQPAPFSSFVGEKEIVLSRYRFEGSRVRRILYRFNAKNYEHFLE